MVEKFYRHRLARGLNPQHTGQCSLNLYRHATRSSAPSDNPWIHIGMREYVIGLSLGIGVAHKHCMVLYRLVRLGLMNLINSECTAYQYKFRAERVNTFQSK